jgi:DUF4097 and DUF4098 domain-containing protein YvlB
MRITCLIARAVPLLLALGGTALGQRSRDPSRVSDEFLENCREGRHRSNDDRARVCDVRESRIAAPRLIDVDGQENGSVNVHGWDRSDVLVQAMIQADAEEEGEARDLANAITIETDRGHIRADGPSSRRRQSWSVTYHIWAPRQTDVRAKTQNGGISVQDVDARLELGAVNGPIDLRGVSGDVRGETTNGPLNVTLDGDQWRGPGLDLRTTNGPVNLEIPDGYSAQLETGTVNGGMRIDFPVTLQGNIGRHITTRLGRGGATIRAVTTNGPVEIHRR